ncbi:Zinc finger protein 706 [Plasmopara halstedii]|uniref:Zinc finger protein 706 n=1 Tax=Plasmopara halstedii TaxID=4781 RepID=A0A0P1B3F5_PLAHL|nr:Zinc finger protein 706 [Plasmopara halstedii]CEG48369.1 Zinc finger protein 706 [Plasmopara halstedii]|eukprot:XP_024584738.1 Zinc finger protein 706 [Plasmopara halstedii]
MGGKAKFKKHTAAELERRQKQVNKGGGKAGASTRGVAKLNFTCDICMSASPDIKSFEQHYASKHAKATFDREAMIQKAEALRESQQDQSAAGSHFKKK